MCRGEGAGGDGGRELTPTAAPSCCVAGTVLNAWSFSFTSHKTAISGWVLLSPFRLIYSSIELTYMTVYVL